MDPDLVWLLCNTKVEEILDKENGNYTGYESSLPLPLSQALASLLKEGAEAKEMVVSSDSLVIRHGPPATLSWTVAWESLR